MRNEVVFTISINDVHYYELYFGDSLMGSPINGVLDIFDYKPLLFALVERGKYSWTRRVCSYEGSLLRFCRPWRTVILKLISMSCSGLLRSD